MKPKSRASLEAALERLREEIRLAEEHLDRVNDSGFSEAFAAAASLTAARRSYDEFARANRHLERPSRDALAREFAESVERSFFGATPLPGPGERLSDEDVLTALFGPAPDLEAGDSLPGGQNVSDAPS